MKPFARAVLTIDIRGAIGTKGIGNPDLHRVHDVEVEEPIEEADPQPLIAVGNPVVRPGMILLQIFDDDRRFEDRAITVEQEWEHPERRMALQLRHVGRVLDHPIVERGPVGPERDEHLLRVTAERVAEELQGHQLPSAISACRARSRSLGGSVA